jgi:hypothetical protein
MRLGRAAVAALVASAISSALAVAAGQSAEPAPQPAGRDPQSAARNPPTPISRLFTIDVSAADARGRAVDDLKPGDFELRADGAVVPLALVRLVRAGAASTDEVGAIESAADERQAASKDEARLFAIFLDEYHVASDSTARVREAILQFVDHDLAPRDLVAVM